MCLKTVAVQLSGLVFFCRTPKGTFTLPQNKLLGFSSFCVQRSNQNPAENCKRIGLAGSTSASAPNLGPFQPPSRAAELIPYTEALQRRIIHSHNWFGSLILKESERKLNIYWKKKIETKKSYTARKLPFAEVDSIYGINTEPLQPAPCSQPCLFKAHMFLSTVTPHHLLHNEVRAGVLALR